VQGLNLTPEEEKLWARQVNVLCVCARMMAIVRAWVQVLLTIFTGCATPIKTARRKRRAGAGLSQDARKAQGLELTPGEEQLLARQVNVLCVCAQMMAIVCAWVQVLIGTCAHWMYGVSFTHLQ